MKRSGATFVRTVLPEVVMNTVSGKSGATAAAASWNSKPWPKTSWKPRRAKSRKPSSNSAGVLVCTCATSAPSWSRMASRPS